MNKRFIQPVRDTFRVWRFWRIRWVIACLGLPEEDWYTSLKRAESQYTNRQYQFNERTAVGAPKPRYDALRRNASPNAERENRTKTGGKSAESHPENFRKIPRKPLDPPNPPRE